MLHVSEIISYLCKRKFNIKREEALWKKRKKTYRTSDVLTSMAMANAQKVFLLYEL